MTIIERYSAPKQLLILLIVLIASVFILTPLGILIAIPFVDGDILVLLQQMELAETAQDIALLKYFQIISQLSLFIASSFAFAFLVAKKPWRYLGLDKMPSLKLIVIAIVIGLVSSPFLDWVMHVNYNMHLPAFLSSLENWMRQMEEEASELTNLFLSGDTVSTLLVNLFMMALLAGLGEELLLRGITQPLFIRITKNAHWGIWIAAALFSFMHLQFLGFFPRLLLGALFGYYYYWSKNLWIPITAHIANNGIIVVYTFFYGTEASGLQIGAVKPEESPSVFLIVLSLSLSIAGLMFFYRESTIQKQE